MLSVIPVWVEELISLVGIQRVAPIRFLFNDSCSRKLKFGFSPYDAMHSKCLIPIFVACIAAGVLHAQSFTNVRVSDPSLTDPEEVTIAINPKNPNQIAAGSNLNYFFASSDAGLTWSWTRLNSQYGFWGDPNVMYDDSGILYYEHLSGAWAQPEFLWRVVVQRSFDAGMSFDSGEQIGLDTPTQQDKAWLGLDRSPTASNGTIMTSWNEDDLYGSRKTTDSSRIFFSKSTDHGETWSRRVRVDHWGGDCVDSSNTVEGAVTTTGPDGTIYIVWSGHNEIFFNRSTDGGKTFGQERAIADQPGGWNFNIPGIFRANGFPMIVSDLNPNSAFYGRLYVMWSDQRRQATDGTGITDIYFISSADGGSTWSGMVRVNNDSAMNHHFFPSMTIDPVTGHLFLAFYDRRHYLDSETDVYLARSTDGGKSFGNIRVSQSAFGPDSGVFFGDYIHISAYNRNVYPIWMRMDDSLLSVWTALVHDSDGFFGSVTAKPEFSESIQATGTLELPGVAFSVAEYGHVHIDLFDLLGRKVFTLLDGTFGSGEYRIPVPQTVTNGAYFAEMTSASGMNVAKINVAR